MPRPDCSLPRPCLAVVAASPRMNDLLGSCGESGILQASRPSGSREISSKDRSNTSSFKTRTSWLFKTPMAIQFTAKDPNCFTPRHFTYCGWQKHEQSLIELLSKSERNRTAYVSSQSLHIFHDHIWLHHSQDQIEQLVARFRFWILRDTPTPKASYIGTLQKIDFATGLNKHEQTNMSHPARFHQAAQYRGRCRGSSFSTTWQRLFWAEIVDVVLWNIVELLWNSPPGPWLIIIND